MDHHVKDPPPDSAADARGAKPPRRLGRLAPKRLMLPVILLAASLVATWYGHYWWMVGRFVESTDDAYIEADVTTLVAKVSGYVSDVPVPENTAVKAGDVVLRIDGGDYALAVRAAEDKIAVQKATMDRMERQIEASEAAVRQAAAQIPAAEATQRQTKADFGRAQKLASSDFGSRQTLDAARAASDKAKASLRGARAALTEAKASVAVTKAQRVEAQATLQAYQTSLASAKRDLAFTTIHAPSDGVIGNRSVQLGSFVSAGSQLMALVPMTSLYVEANFKETQLQGIHRGQKAALHVDALKDITLDGRVESLSAASGSVFSLLPAENATGNFTKVVQRVPVRIAITDPDASELLRPGLSVVVDVDTRSASRDGAQAAQ